MTSANAPVAGIVGAGDATGGAIARHLARGSHTVCTVRRSADVLQPLLDAIRAEGGQAHGLVSDARKEDDVVALFADIEQRIGTVATHVEFWFDVGSPAADLAWIQLPRLLRATGAEVEYKPFLLGGVFQATGNRWPMQVVARGKYMQDDLQRFAPTLRSGVQPQPAFPIRTLTLMRGAIGLQMREPGRLRAYLDTVFRAIWVEGRNMNEVAAAAAVAAVLQGAGFDTQQLQALAADPAVKDKMKKVTQEAVERGGFGAPTFLVGKQMYWGRTASISSRRRSQNEQRPRHPRPHRSRRGHHHPEPAGAQELAHGRHVRRHGRCLDRRPG
jgi:2-hydroxychromene-2-carboxylate isomerase